MTKFKVGDEVICKNASPSKTCRYGNILIKDKIYTIEKATAKYVWLKETRRSPSLGWNDYYSKDRFMLVKEETNVQPKFEVGDKVTSNKQRDMIYTISEIRSEGNQHSYHVFDASGRNWCLKWYPEELFTLYVEEKKEMVKTTYRAGDEVWVKGVVVNDTTTDYLLLVAKDTASNASHYVNVKRIVKHIPRKLEMKVGSQVKNNTTKSIGRVLWMDDRGVLIEWEYNIHRSYQSRDTLTVVTE